MDRPEILHVGKAPDWYLREYDAEFVVHHMPTADPAALPRGLAGRLEVVVSGGPVRRDFIAALPRLRLIANPAAGYERVDVAAAIERGVLVSNAPGANDACVADMAFALLLAVARRVLPADRFVRGGNWPGHGFALVRRASGRRIGILGLGRIGSAIARRAAGFDMTVSYHNRNRRPDVGFAYCDSPEALAAASDYLVVACPGGPQTRHLVNERVLHALGSDGIVVNIARGTIIDEAALVRALAERRIAGAGLDVFENEPEVPEALRSLDTVVLTPHAAGGSFETWKETGEIVRSNIRAFLRGEALPTPVPEMAGMAARQR
ncbi:MAG: 2-hydroxyacid dehydrogenase [Acidisphaera sp.]|nr:2-hydroxyacid dehydrogenase [Acidisphaera sp.]